MTRRATAAVLVASLGATMVAAGPTAPAAAADAADEPRPIILDAGHIDLFELTYDQPSAQLVLSIKDDTERYDLDVSYRRPETVTVDVDAALAAIDLAEIPEGYEFLGEPGTFYLLDIGQQEGLPWPGWSTERLLGTLPAGVELAFADDTVELEVAVDGPGELFTFMPGADGTPSNRYIDTTDAVPDVIQTGPSIHAHTAWMFTELGDYHLTVTPRVTATDGTLFTGPPASYHFHIGDRLAAPPVPPEELGATITGWSADPVPFGTAVDLVVTTDPSRPDFAHQWYRWVDGQHDVKIPGASTPRLAFTATDSAQYYVALLDASGRVVTVAYAFISVAAPSDLAQTITAELRDAQGALSISVDPDDRTVELPRFELGGEGDRWMTTGELRPTTVIDTRGGQPGWVASAQLTDLTAPAGTLAAAHLGWAPDVLATSPGQSVDAGAEIASVLDGGPGLAGSATLATGAVGQSRGTARLGAALRVVAPTTLDAGTYTGVLTLTVV